MPLGIPERRTEILRTREKRLMEPMMRTRFLAPEVGSLTHRRGEVLQEVEEACPATAEAE
jgi:hypothetical protein